MDIGKIGRGEAEPPRIDEVEGAKGGEPAAPVEEANAAAGAPAFEPSPDDINPALMADPGAARLEQDLASDGVEKTAGPRRPDPVLADALDRADQIDRSSLPQQDRTRELGRIMAGLPRDGALDRFVREYPPRDPFGRDHPARRAARERDLTAAVEGDPALQARMSELSPERRTRVVENILDGTRLPHRQGNVLGNILHGLRSDQKNALVDQLERHGRMRPFLEAMATVPAPRFQESLLEGLSPENAAAARIGYQSGNDPAGEEVRSWAANQSPDWRRRYDRELARLRNE